MLRVIVTVSLDLAYIPLAAEYGHNLDRQPGPSLQETREDTNMQFLVSWY